MRRYLLALVARAGKRKGTILRNHEDCRSFQNKKQILRSQKPCRYRSSKRTFTHPDLDDIPGFFFDFYGQVWPFWIFCAIVILSEALLLIIPVRIVKQRPRPQRGLWATAIAAGALFAVLALGMVWSIVAAALGDGSIESIVFLLALIFLLINWVVWSCIFRAFARNNDPGSYIRRLMKWLLRGTILELLIAVPSHVIVRHKDVCCAHGVTALGIATGLTVMLISFGPGIYFLYAERIQSKKPKTESAESG